LQELKYNTGVFPRRALQEALAHKDEIVPALLKVIEDAKSLPEVLYEDRYMEHIYAMYLLAQFRERSAYPLIVDFFSIPGDITVDSTGDVVTEDLHRILASVSHGDTSLIKALAENDDANEYVRGAALDALLTQLVCGEATRQEVMAYYASLFRGGLTRKPSLAWASLVSCSTDLYPEELMGDIRQAFEEGLVDEMFIDRGYVMEVFARGKERALRELYEDSKRRFIEDVIKDIEWWACFNRPAEGQAASGKQKVGRNDPCPCGSGKKYKKCCGK